MAWLMASQSNDGHPAHASARTGGYRWPSPPLPARVRRAPGATSGGRHGCGGPPTSWRRCCTSSSPSAATPTLRWCFWTCSPGRARPPRRVRRWWLAGWTSAGYIDRAGTAQPRTCSPRPPVRPSRTRLRWSTLASGCAIFRRPTTRCERGPCQWSRPRRWLPGHPRIRAPRRSCLRSQVGRACVG